LSADIVQGTSGAPSRDLPEEKRAAQSLLVCIGAREVGAGNMQKTYSAPGALATMESFVASVVGTLTIPYKGGADWPRSSVI
jgi:hypothetical protein